MAQSSRVIRLVAVGVLLLLSACSQEQPEQEADVVAATLPPVLPSPTATQTATPFPTISPSPTATQIVIPTNTPQPTATTAVATVAPTAVPPLTVDFLFADDIALSIPDGLTLEPPQGLSLLANPLLPERIQISFGAQLPSEPLFVPREARILVFDLVAYIAEDDSRAAEVEQLIDLLNTPTPNSATLPFIPRLELNQTFVAQTLPLPFRNGSGVRYLTQFDQIPGPIHNESIFYTFQGLTEDQTRLVTAYFPLSTTALPADFEDSDLTAFGTDESRERYFAQTTVLLNELAPGDFQPSLGQLDQLIASLQVGLDGREVVVATPVPENSDIPNGLGRITGTISYPEADGPILRVYAQSTEANGRYFFVNTIEDRYQLDVPPGEYILFAYTTSTVLPGGYTLRSLCAPDEDCANQSPAPVTVTLGDVTSGIDIVDWTITDPTFPVPPDGLSGSGTQVAELGTISGDIVYPDNNIPALIIYFQDLNDDDFYVLETNTNQSFYSIDLPPGEYVVYAWLEDGTAAGGHTQEEDALTTVFVQGGQTTGEITIGEFNSPPLNYIPAPPDA